MPGDIERTLPAILEARGFVLPAGGADPAASSWS
jgi:hypothetical protein